MEFTRRAILQSLAVSASGFTFGLSRSQANPLDRPIGLQLYTVGDQLEKDFHGTLKLIAGIGYKEVELAQTHSKTAPQLRKAFKGAGLT